MLGLKLIHVSKSGPWCLTVLRRVFIFHWLLMLWNAYSLIKWNDCSWLLTLNVWGPSYHGLTRSISWLPMPWSRQDISSHDIDYIEYVGPSLTWGRILYTCVISMWSNNTKCKYMFMFPLKNLAHKELRMLHRTLSDIATGIGIVITLNETRDFFIIDGTLPK